MPFDCRPSPNRHRRIRLVVEAFTLALETEDDDWPGITVATPRQSVFDAFAPIEIVGEGADRDRARIAVRMIRVVDAEIVREAAVEPRPDRFAAGEELLDVLCALCTSRAGRRERQRQNSSPVKRSFALGVARKPVEREVFVRIDAEPVSNTVKLS